jgi:Protein of unknown function (DUF2393)
MGGLIEPSPVAEERDTSKRTILIAIAVVAAVVGVVALILRESPQAASGPPPYAANLKFSDLKMSQAQNFVGATVTYVDGTLTDAGDKTVTNVVVQVTFKDLYGQVAQIETVPVKVLQTGGPYLDTVDLTVSPLAPGQSKPFRLTFEHLSEQWNQAYPDLQITDVRVN